MGRHSMRFVVTHRGGRRGNILTPTPSSPQALQILTLTTHLHETTPRSQEVVGLLFIPSHIFTTDAFGEEDYCAALGVFTDIPCLVSSVPFSSESLRLAYR